MTAMAHNTIHELDEHAETALVDASAPPVRIEPCAHFRLDHASPWGVCESCGWLDDDHAPAEWSGAVVTELPRRSEVRRPERKAS